MKNFTDTPITLVATIDVAQRVAFLEGQDELIRLDHDHLHAQIVDVQEALDCPPAVMVDMVALQSNVFAVENEIRGLRKSISGSVAQAYKDAGAVFANFYAKTIIEVPVHATLTLISKRSGKHKVSTERAVEIIEGSSWWSEYRAQEEFILAERSRAKSGIDAIADEYAQADKLHSQKVAQHASLRGMERALETQLRENTAELSKWHTFVTAGLSEVSLPPAVEKVTATSPFVEIWCAQGVTNVYLWSPVDLKLIPVNDLQLVPGNERSGIRFVAGEGSYAWSVRYANYRRTVSFPNMELVVSPRPAPSGASVFSTTNVISVMDTSG
ncbi:hypothetical protein [Glutamicibacter ardleyensis]|uniref:hypothetical protein n=1 Tax=Glutamicibacter ardleyensis TaxID=225894 RepID=UPI003FD3A317